MRSWRSKAAIVVAVSLLAGVLTVAPTTEAPQAEAAVASDFDPGNLISDANFFDGDAMSASQVQSFITQRHPGCTTGYTCLPQYAQSTPSIAADAYCSAYTGSSRESAASIIAKAAAACDVSPRVLLVLLEKEQSLVTHRSPSATRYEKATGFGCPDTAPCDASVGGFFYQVYYGARQFQRYAAHPESYNHRAGVVNRILYNPNAACGSSPVLIQNQATAGLYNYTPYQPNAAALRNLYGSGDTCSAYGNRNFWRMYTDWFGDPRSGGVQALLRDTSNGKVYLVVGTARHHVTSPALLAEYTPAFGASRDVPPATIATYAEGAALSRVVLSTTGSLLLVDNGQAYRFTSCGQAQAFGYACTGHARLDSTLQERLGPAPIVAAIVEASDGHDWLIQSSTRRELASLSTPTRYGYPPTTVALDPEVIAHLPVGSPVLESGDAVRDVAASSVRIRTERGNVALTPQQSSLAAMGALQGFTAESMAQLAPGGGTIGSSRLRDSSGSYLLTDAGMLRIDPAKYGGTGLFPTRSDMPTVRAALPSAGTATGPHFVQEQGSTMRYLASGARLQPVADDASYDFIRSRFGVPARVWVVPPATLEGVPKIVGVAAGDLVRGSDGRVLLWDGEKAMHVMHPEIVAALGIAWNVQTVGDDVVRSLAAGPSLGGIGFRCGGVDRVAIDGQLRQYATDAARAGWGLRHVELSAELCGSLRTSTAKVTQFVNDPAGRTYLMEEGKRRYITSPSVFSGLGGWTVGRTLVPTSTVALLPAGDDVVAILDPGTWVRGADGRVYLWDGSKALYLMLPEFATALGLQIRITPTAADVVASLPKGQWIAGYAFRCGSTDYLAYDGALHRFATPQAAAAWRVAPVTIAAPMCAKLQVATSTVTQFVYDSSGRTYFVQDGKLRYVSSPSRFSELGGWTIGRTLLPKSVIDRLPKGPNI